MKTFNDILEQFRQSWNTFVKIIDDKLEKIQGGV